MKNFISNNIGLKLLSLLLALLLWLTVMNVEDPTVTKTISDIPVQIVNDDVIKSRGYGYTIESGEKLDIRIKGRRSVVDHITADDFTATADFSSVSSMKMVPIEVNCTDEHAAEMTWTARTDSMAIILENEETASKSIRLDKTGDVKEGYYLYECSTDTSLVSVKGAESQVANVKEVVAQVDISGLKDSTDMELPVYAVNSEGERIDAKKITLVPDTIKVHITINPIKEVPLSVRTNGEPAQYHYIGEIEYAPQQIQVTAEAEVLEKLTALEVDVSVDDSEEDIEKQVNLEEYIERYYRNLGLKVVDQNTTMGIKVPIIKMEEQSLEIKPEDIVLTGTDDENFEYTVSMGWLSKILVRGKAEEMTNIEASDFNLYVDVTGIVEGSYSLDVRSNYMGSLVIEPGKMNVSIVEKEHAPVNVQEEGQQGELHTDDQTGNQTGEF